MTYMEWITRVYKLRAMEYMRLPDVKRREIRNAYQKWYAEKYNKVPVKITI